DTYKMTVYPSHRVVDWPKEIKDATFANATSCELVGTDQPNSCKLGFPFPAPKSGAQVVWNHKLTWRGEAVTRHHNQMIIQPDGLAVPAGPAPHPPRADGVLRQPVRRHRRPPVLRPGRHVQRGAGALQLEARGQEGDVCPREWQQAGRPADQVQGHGRAAPP